MRARARCVLTADLVVGLDAGTARSRRRSRPAVQCRDDARSAPRVTPRAGAPAKAIVTRRAETPPGCRHPAEAPGGGCRRRAPAPQPGHIRPSLCGTPSTLRAGAPAGATVPAHPSPSQRLGALTRTGPQRGTAVATARSTCAAPVASPAAARRAGERGVRARSPFRGALHGHRLLRLARPHGRRPQTDAGRARGARLPHHLARGLRRGGRPALRGRGRPAAHADAAAAVQRDDLRYVQAEVRRAGRAGVGPDDRDRHGARHGAADRSGLHPHEPHSLHPPGDHPRRGEDAQRGGHEAGDDPAVGSTPTAPRPTRASSPSGTPT